MKIKRAQWLPYFKALAARMRLGGWEFVISNEPPEGGNASASINCWFGRFSATIRLSDGFLEETEEEQRYVCVHELVHCYQAHADELISEKLSQSDKDAWTLASEYGVDAAAQTIAQFMPLPREVLKPRKKGKPTCNSKEPQSPGTASPPASPPSSDCPSTNSSGGSATTGRRSSGTTYLTPRRGERSTRRR